jgi:sulfur carrier protein ThiS
MSTATLIWLTNPFQPERNRHEFTATAGITIDQWLDKEKIEFLLPILCLKNGEPLLRAQWAIDPLSANDTVIFIPLLQGGGGGGNKILRSVLTIAVMVAAPYAGSALAGSLGITSTVGTALVTAGVALAGSALVNVLVPPPMPSLGGGYGNTAAPSPTYSLQAQGNQARLGQPIPVLYGRHIIYPDLAATPYTRYENNEQMLYQLHCIGQGQYDLESIRIEDTPISSFEEIHYEVVPPGSPITLFDADVVTAPEVAGQELLAVSDGGDIIGPFVANPADTQAERLSIDVLCPRGLYYANDSGGLETRSLSWRMEAQAIDAEGEAVSDWFVLGQESHSAATNTALRFTFDYSVTPGRYAVRATRLDSKDTSARAGHELRWGALKAHLVGQPEFGDVTLLALRMRATDNLSQRSSRLVNCVVTRRLPIWEPDTQKWSAPQPTRSIAWALADQCRALYGAGLTDARIDLQALAELDVIWNTRGDSFDAVFDQGVTVWESLSRTARCGRAVSYMQGGTVRFVRDAPKTIPVALFSPRNIVKGSLRIEYLMASDDTADSVTVEYFSARTWARDEITASLTDSSTTQPARVQLFGCTTQAQAEREGRYMAAANRYRRKLITFQTELEGLIPSYGDLIAISHDMPSWGQSAEVTAIDDQTLTLSEPLTWANDGQHYIALRRPNGEVSGPWQVEPGEASTQVILTQPIDITPYTGEQKERTHLTFGVGEQWATLARVTEVRPRGELVEIGCVAEHPAVHD